MMETVIEPRKSPVQARSAASVDAILEATLQVLLQVGKERLTTTRVAARAGVSVGTLYQYFPNKGSLLRAALRQHMDEIAGAVERICLEQRGRSLEEMGTALVSTFLKWKMKDGKESVALYSVSSDVDGAAVAREMGVRLKAAIVAMLKTAQEPLTTDVELVAEMLQGVMAGGSRKLLEATDPAGEFERMQRELVVMSCAYLKACSGGASR